MDKLTPEELQALKDIYRIPGMYFHINPLVRAKLENDGLITYDRWDNLYVLTGKAIELFKEKGNEEAK